MIDLGLLIVFIWLGCFLVVAWDSAFQHISPVFWRLAALVAGPFALATYGIVRERRNKE